jgi:hypothetical protein
MKKEEFESLLTEYGNLSFECGEFDARDEEFTAAYYARTAYCAAAKQAVLDAYMELMSGAKKSEPSS